MRWVRDDRGSIAPAMPIIAMALLLLGGLGIDGSRQLNARGESTAFAEEAARAGAQAIDPGSTELQLDKADAEDRANKYCDDVLRLGQVTYCKFKRVERVSEDDPRELVVVTEVHTEVQTSLLSMVGVQTLHASAIAKARPFEGVREANELPADQPDPAASPSPSAGAGGGQGGGQGGTPGGGAGGVPSGAPSGAPSPSAGTP